MSAGSEPTAEEKLALLRANVRGLGSVLVCYSGGIDSALVLAVAHAELGKNAVGMTAVSPSLAPSERDGAAEIAKEIGARHEVVHSNELAREGYRANGADRCFHCKSELYSIAEEKRREWNLGAIANGTNADDLGDHRPGLRAAADANVRSPLLDAGFRKSDVRAVAKLLGLTIWDKPALACLSSRIPYGTSVTTERLAQIGALEADLHALGLREVRVRWHETVARIEVPAGDLERAAASPLRESIVDAGTKHGFVFVALDLAGYRSGSLNRALGKRSLSLVG